MIQISRDVFNENIVTKTKYNKPNSNRNITKLDDLEDKISDASTLTHINQCNTDKQILERKIENVDKYLTPVS